MGVTRRPPGGQVQLIERLESRVTLSKNAGELCATGRLEIPEIGPLTPCYFEIA